MAENRLKMKIGDHEFEAEGPVDIVQAQLKAFTDLISNMPATVEKAVAIAPEQDPPTGSGQLSLDKIMRSEGRIISLTVRAESVADAALLLIYGQRHFRSNDSVTGGEVLDGMRESGTPVPRIDYTLNRLSDDGYVITVGSGRGRRYRLTNTGIAKSQEIARSLIALVP